MFIWLDAGTSDLFFSVVMNLFFYKIREIFFLGKQIVTSGEELSWMQLWSWCQFNRVNIHNSF